MPTQVKKSKATGGSEMYNKCISLRWLIVDEVSTASLYVLGVVEKNLRKAKEGSAFAEDAHGHKRDWGGINVIVCGDWLQLPPVAAKSIFRNPFKKDYGAVEQTILNMFWNMGDVKPMPSSPNLLFELTEQVRSKDEWMNYVLARDRDGAESWEIYCFTHGLPTRHVGSWLPDRDRPACGALACQRLQDTIWPRQVAELHGKWSDMQPQECEYCQQERRRRCQVLDTSQADGGRGRFAEFARASYVHPFNQPKYHALICHAVQFAQTTSQQVLWCIAQDWPLTAEDEVMTPAELQKNREAWLTTHDQRTAGIMGLLPLVKDMPLRFTDTIDRSQKVFKHSSGVLRKVVLEDAEADRVAQLRDNEVVLQAMPACLVIEISEGHEQPILFELKSEYVAWSRDRAENAKVRRRGFRVVPDFAGTAHAYCGETLSECKGDLLEWFKVPTLDAMLRAYIIKSRVHYTEKCLLVRPYSPYLFKLGSQPGPNLLLRRQRGDTSLRELKTAWKEIQASEDSDKDKWKDWPWTMMLPCRSCSDHARSENPDAEDVLLPLKAFINPSDGLKKAWERVSQGQHLMCPKCRRSQYHSADMFCEGCVSLLPLSRFHIDMSQKWRNDEMSRFLCMKCDGHKKTTLGIWCSGCRREWISSAFDDAEQRKKSTEEGQPELQALCRRCKAEDISGEKLSETHKCHKCGVAKQWREYSPVVLQVLLNPSARGVAQSRKLTCEECQYPPCAGAGCPNGNAASTTPPPHNAFHNGMWYCDSCRFPPCAAGCGAPRPASSRKYARWNMAEWTCQTCQGKAVQVCGTCGQQALRSIRDMDLHEGVWYCLSCKYPPCAAGCGTPRPAGSSKFWRWNMPEWTCEACQEKRIIVCGDCGQVADGVPRQYFP